MGAGAGARNISRDHAVDDAPHKPADPDESDYSLVASLSNTRNLCHPEGREHTTCFAPENGIRVTVENAKHVQADAFIWDGIFQEFKVQEEPVTFQINLTVLLDCLSIFESSPVPGNLTVLRMCYQGLVTQ